MIKRIRYIFSGTVQGVGFRPFIYRIAVAHKLSGFVRNTPDGVIAEVEGPHEAIENFINDVRTKLPPLASISDWSQQESNLLEDKGFRILASETDGRGDVHITPDSATCPDCLHELFDEKDRRYRYPFINCTNCGPRLTIISDIPYDRPNTSMACFPMCPDCRREYENPADRRFHAEPNACPVCGPKLRFLTADGKPVRDADPLLQAVRALKFGCVIAIKGLGGFHLAVDAANDAAVKRLRSRKYREEKPLAIMVKNLEEAERLADLDDEEKALLASTERPIVLVQKNKDLPISEAVAPGMANLGIMLPYTPLHHLLLEKEFRALVMTSANQTDEPICIGNREALERLKGIADYFLIHDRDILVRCDDSIVISKAGRTILQRRSRGFAPKPLPLNDSYPHILALGPQLKNTVCILKGRFAYLSPHIGDLETPQARDFFNENVKLIKRIAECSPRIIACDLHPGYYTTTVAESMEADRIISVQHHHAHIVSCMAENGLSGELIGIALDGTGYGPDGRVWGGEFLVADESGFERIGHLGDYLLPGGEKAIHEPWRTAASLLYETFGDKWIEYAERLHILPDRRGIPVLEMMLTRRINSPYTTSMGRLFDGVASILGLRQKVSFEGQAAMELEGAAFEAATIGTVYPFSINAVPGDSKIGDRVHNRLDATRSPRVSTARTDGEGSLILDMTPAIRAMVEEKLAGNRSEDPAFSFHRTLVVAIAAMSEKIRAITGLNRIALSGGCFQNRVLLNGCHNILSEAGFVVYTHHLVPTNDGCISLGQAVSAGARLKLAL